MLKSNLAGFSTWLVLGVSVEAQNFITEDFSGTLSSSLQESTPDAFTVGGGRAYVNNGSRNYISTVNGAYLSASSFTMSVTYTVPLNGGGQGIAFFGVGAGTPDGDFYGEPYKAVYVRSMPNNFSGNADSNFNYGDGTGGHTQSVLGHPSNGSFRAEITKNGNSLTFGIDNNLSGPFAPSYSVTYDIPGALSFLDPANSRPFFGAQSSQVLFSNLTLSAVPEPSAAAVSAGVALAGVGAWRSRARRLRG